MSKRQASEALDELQDVATPASKRSRMGDFDSPLANSSHDDAQSLDQDADARKQGTQDARSEDEDADDDDQDLDNEPMAAPVRQSGPADGYDDLYLDTIDRNVLDFDFEKLCSVSLSNINVYACLVCGKYYQGRGVKSHAYFHSLDEDHHVFINLETQKVYVLPEGYEVKSKSLDDIKYVSDPRYTKEEVIQLDRRRPSDAVISWTLDGKPYTPGFVGMNNIKDNDYLNVVVQALSHVSPLRNYFLLEDFSNKSELVKRCSILFRKIWNPRAFKAHVSPHELLQEVALQSNKRFTLTRQSDPVEFLSWNIIPQVPLSTILSKYDGKRAQEHHAQRKRYRLLHPLPPFLMLHVKRFSQNKFVAERNPTIVTFDARNLDVSPYVEPNPSEWPVGEPIWYDLVANVVHEAVRKRDDVADSGEEKKTWKVQLKNKATDEWVVCQDLFVDKVQSELLYLGETYLQIWERRRVPGKKADKGKTVA
ncbi:cysteine proteinase [Trichoderma longibrachiatum ATCC 18648]|uniref:Cysteine proteinase n=1 Tax=Trichoderma longibrachiatum ATCC 18648 TaxID=983965 RepID=A0A2T4BYS5_TRILO|nr:cysteine proteinase [Trichoderma longibrachiatum ATCC 18648]